MGIVFLLSLGTVTGFLCGLLRSGQKLPAMLLSIGIGIIAALVSGVVLPGLFGFPSVAMLGSTEPGSIAIALAGTIAITPAAHLLLRSRP